MSHKLTPNHLERDAIVYVRQSSMLQVHHNLESQRRQYGLAELARQLGFQKVQVIDEDLGRSGSGLVARPGFQSLVAAVCSGAVGAVFCLEASRLARNGRDWHHLIELCALVSTVLVDADGVYDPAFLNDRLLLGLKGTMSEFELNLFRQRSREAIRQKAQRGELAFRLPAGLCRHEDGTIDLEPDQRFQHALRLVFAKMQELGSVRQVYLWFRQEQQSIPVRTPAGGICWKVPVYSSVMNVLSNPFYAGAYAFGRTQVRTRVVDGRARKSAGHRRRQRDWQVLIPDHHPGYISWEQYERNQQTIEANAHMKSRMQPKAGRGGRSLLIGLLRCRRCGRMLKVNYTGAGGTVLRYSCRGEPLEGPEHKCISFGGLSADERVGEQLLEAISGNAIDAALEAAEQDRARHREQRRSLEMAWEQARYESRLAARRYEAVDPDRRLVASELEARWNAALGRVAEMEEKLEGFDAKLDCVAIPSRELLTSLAQDLPAIWNHPSTDAGLKQRIVRLVLREIVADVDEANREVILILHWEGGRHTEIRWVKSKLGQHRRANPEAVEIVRKMAGRYSDDEIAMTLNRLCMKTGAGNHSWTAGRVAYTRANHKLREYDPKLADGRVSMAQAAKKLQVSAPTVRRLIQRGVLPAQQMVPCAPWEIEEQMLKSEPVREAIAAVRRGDLIRTQSDENQQDLFSDS
jgi:DNA invertase Pin-like site-specific DNA recombinase